MESSVWVIAIFTQTTRVEILYKNLSPQQRLSLNIPITIALKKKRKIESVWGTPTSFPGSLFYPLVLSLSLLRDGKGRTLETRLWGTLRLLPIGAALVCLFYILSQPRPGNEVASRALREMQHSPRLAHKPPVLQVSYSASNITQANLGYKLLE